MASENNRFGRLIERQDSADFPFYNLIPEEVTTWKWLLAILACAAGFAALAVIGFTSQVLELIPRALFVAIPLTAFVLLVRPNWRAIFRPLTWRDVGTMVLFWLLNLVVSGLVAIIVSGGAPGSFTQNSATDGLLEGGPMNVLAFYLGTFIQLFGEELFTVLPFLALLYWCYSTARMSRRTAIILAWIVTAIWFGAAHLPTYEWNVVQAIVVIGSARMILTLAFIRTKNILVSFGAHLLNDWVTFTLALIATAR